MYIITFHPLVSATHEASNGVLVYITIIFIFTINEYGQLYPISVDAERYSISLLIYDRQLCKLAFTRKLSPRIFARTFNKGLAPGRVCFEVGNRTKLYIIAYSLKVFPGIRCPIELCAKSEGNCKNIARALDRPPRRRSEVSSFGGKKVSSHTQFFKRGQIRIVCYIIKLYSCRPSDRGKDQTASKYVYLCMAIDYLTKTYLTISLDMHRI